MITIEQEVQTELWQILCKNMILLHIKEGNDNLEHLNGVYNKSDNLALAGGTMLNCTSNGKIAQKRKSKRESKARK